MIRKYATVEKKQYKEWYENTDSVKPMGYNEDDTSREIKLYPYKTIVESRGSIIA